MKDNFIHVTFVIDQSGSMSGKEEDIIGGFKKTIDEQKAVKDGTCAVSLYTFDDTVKQVYLGKDINDVSKLDYSPGGMTAMFDGIGTAIDEVGEWLGKMDESERPSKNLIVVMTDGLENMSKKYNSSKIKEMIKHQEDKYNWSFIYMGADVTDSKDADNLGFKLQSYSHKADIKSNFEDITKGMTSYRCCYNDMGVTGASATMESLLSAQALSKTSAYVKTTKGTKIKNA